jgi:hypothetical protein
MEERNKFVVSDSPSSESLQEMEQRLFGLFRCSKLQHITDEDFVPLRTGTGAKLMK